MAVAVRGSTPLVVSTTSNPISGTLNGTRQPQAGDLLVIIHGNNYYTAAAMPTPTVGGSSTGVTAVTGGSADSGSNLAHIKSYTYVVGSTGDLTVAVSETGSADEEKVLVVYVLSGADTSTPIDVAQGTANGLTQSSLVLTGVTANTADAFLIYHVNNGGGSANGSPYTPPGGTSEAYDAVTGGIAYTGGTEQLAASGATGTRTVTGNAPATWAGVLIAVRTAAAGATPAAGQAAATGAGQSPVAASGAGAGQATATGAGQSPSASAGVPGGAATASGAANNPTVTTTSDVTVAAGAATAAGTANSPASAAGVNAGDAAGAGTAPHSGPADRTNLCPNPALGTDATGWSSSSIDWDRATDVAGLPRTTGWRLISPDGSGSVVMPTAPAAAGRTYTCSLYLRNFSTFDATRAVYVAFTRSAGGDDFTNTADVSMLDGQVTRASLTATAPADTTGVYFVVDTLNPGVTAGVSGWEVTAALYEEAATLGSYFDGDSPGATWLGADDNSSSFLAGTGGDEAVGGNAAPATAAGAALDPSVSTTSNTNAAAGQAAATGAGHGPAVAAAAGIGVATATGEALFDAGSSISLDLVADNPVDAAGVAYAATVSTAAGAAPTPTHAVGAGTAANPSVTTSSSTSAAATEATGTGAAPGPAVAVAAPVGQAAATGAAFGPSVSTVPQTSPDAGTASGAGIAVDPVAAVQVLNAAAAAVAQALDPAVLIGGPGSAAAGSAAGTGTAFGARPRKVIPRPQSGTTVRPFAGVTLRP